MDGHILVVPRKHIGTIYLLTAAEQKALWALVSEVRARLLIGLMPYSFSIGIKDKLHGGTTTDHAAVHIVPRRHGDYLKLRADLDWVTDDRQPPAES